MAALIVDFPQDHIRTPLQKKSSRSVSFDQEMEVKFVSNLSIHHKSDLWFSRRDYQLFKHDLATAGRLIRAKRTISEKDDYLNLLLQEAGEEDGDTVSFLGLERHLSDSTMENIVNARRRILGAIFVEQDHQMNEGFYDADALANVSEAESEWSRQRARVIGLLHASC